MSKENGYTDENGKFIYGATEDLSNVAKRKEEEQKEVIGHIKAIIWS
jgi:hypothetical protein